MIFTETAIYERDGVKQGLPGFDEKYHNIVDYILKITEEIWEKRAIWVIYETYSPSIPVYVGAKTITGVEEVVKGTLKTLSAFPDRKMEGEAVIWSKVDENHLYSSHRIGSRATNLGDTEYGPATGKEVFFRTIADCLVSENKIIEEWLVRDNLHLVQQLGFDPIEMAKRDQRYKDHTGLASQASTGKNSPSFESALEDSNTASLIVDLYKDIWNARNYDALSQYYTALAFVQTICGREVVGLGSIQRYMEELFQIFPNAVIILERVSCNERAEDTEIAARWTLSARHDGGGFLGPASGKTISMPGICHYVVKDGKIIEEWMVFDGFDVLCQIYSDHHLNIPEENSVTNHPHLVNKQFIHSFFQEWNEVSKKGYSLLPILEKYASPELCLNITKPFEEMVGLQAFDEQFWQPLQVAFPDLENQPYILIGGQHEGRNYVSCTGNFIGTFEQAWLDIPPTHQPTWLRYAGHFLIENNKITKAWFFFDLLDVMRQVGFHFFPNRGVEWVPPAPMTGDGIVLYPTSAENGEKTHQLTQNMLTALGQYDGKTLDSMGQERFWDVLNMMWYGPSGIGTTRGLKGFQDNHQVPFLVGFPDRGITPKEGKDYFAAFGDGNYSCDFGFPAMYGSHNGNDWLGLKATGKDITLRVVDYWRREGDLLRENWVFIDMIDILEQLGIDVFDLLQTQIKQLKNGKNVPARQAN